MTNTNSKQIYEKCQSNKHINLIEKILRLNASYKYHIKSCVQNLEQTIFDYCLQRKDIGNRQYRMNI